jgi:hypothetical protein
MSSRSSAPTGLGLAGREDSWNYRSDTMWFPVMSSNEIVFACGIEHPTLSAGRAVGLLLEAIGPDAVRRMIDGFEAA